MDSNLSANVFGSAEGTGIPNFDDPWVDCEICDEPVRFSDYIRHTQHHMMMSPFIQLAQQLRAGTLGGFAPLPDNVVSVIEHEQQPTLVIRTADSNLTVFIMENIREELEDDSPPLGLDVNTVTMPLATEAVTEPCPVCYKDTSEVSDWVKTCVCSHVYCKPCISQWLAHHTQCPTCRSGLHVHHAPQSPAIHGDEPIFPLDMPTDTP